MQIHQFNYLDSTVDAIASELSSKQAQLVLAFGHARLFDDPKHYQKLAQMFPNAIIAGCSSGGHALGRALSDEDMSISVITLESSRVKMAVAPITPEGDMDITAKQLIDQLAGDDLKHIFILADGLSTNGSKLVNALVKLVGNTIDITGGLGADGTRFEKTWVMANGPAKPGQIAAIGFYGDRLLSRSGCAAGWNEFGVERIITKSIGNIVYEIDNQPALTLYEKYLGQYAAELPGSAFRFPLSIRANQNQTPVIRTVLGIDREAKSLIFAGDIPEGYLGRLMTAQLEDLIDSAGEIAQQTSSDGKSQGDLLCLVVSCVGRRVLLQQLTEEELEIIQSTLGPHAKLTGFYSYGELGAYGGTGHLCQFHNQTISITALSE